jgi:hypothetical protein
MGEFYLMTRKRLRRQVIEFVDVRGFDDPQDTHTIAGAELELSLAPGCGLVFGGFPILTFSGSSSNSIKKGFAALYRKDQSALSEMP